MSSEPAGPDVVVAVTDLSVWYGDTAAVDGLSLSVRRGEVLALLGPNGAGKTTLVEVLEGHRRPSAGRVDVLGYDPATGGRDFRERIGIVLQEAGFDEDATVRELVELHAGLYPRRRGVDDVIDLVGLRDKRAARVRTLSGGQRRRLDLALGIVGAPELLFLDEPTTGFDPEARRQAWALVLALRDAGTTIVLTTHAMEEAQHLADRLAIMTAGRFVAVGTPDQLMAADARRGPVLTFRLPEGTTAADLPALSGPVEADGALVRVRCATPTRDLALLTGWALALGGELADLHLSRPSLEDVYLELVHRARVDA